MSREEQLLWVVIGFVVPKHEWMGIALSLLAFFLAAVGLFWKKKQ